MAENEVKKEYYMMNINFDWHEIDILINLLHEKGIYYLIGNGSSLNSDQKEVEPVQLIQRLAACGYPLVESALISFFILHPELAPSVKQAIEISDKDVAEMIVVLTLATLYLQQWWLFRLTFALGHLPSFPEAPFVSLWEERHLPSPESGYGRDGMLALQEYEQKRYNLPINFLGDWQNQIDHLLSQEESYQRELSDELRDTLVKLSLSKG